MPGGNDRMVLSVQAVMVRAPYPQGTCPASPFRKRQRRVGDEMRGAVHVYPVIPAPIERVPYFSPPSAHRNAPGDGERRLCLIPVRPTRALELEAAVVRDINLFVRVFHQE